MNTQVILKNPMHRSGFALAGAQDTLDAWGRGEVSDTNNDGIVTAEEVGGLKLGETKLVVLSACETGVGKSRSGKGVLGLRRGFILAGAQHLMMTLWPVTDEITPKIMVDFHKEFQKGNNAPQALVDVQRTWLVKLRKERGLCDAVTIAGPFILSSQGNQ
ncbi:MAG: CHAT domain-containing protein [Candidatus Brocadia sp.]|nr:CHAT domain-containing protein [Candidatus Brocadia sp.]MDG6026117.1 CHAT domain-containing protein [Candidatus Brocadia sp.]